MRDLEAGEPFAGAAPLEEWLGRNLVSLVAICGPAQLGIVCARIGLSFASIAPPHLPIAERVSRLLSDLTQRGRLLSLAAALLTDEGTAAAATELGLSALMGEARPPERLPAPCICHPLPPPPAWLGRDAELGALDTHVRTGAQVVLLRGAAGAGKSALLGRWVRELLVANPTEVGSSGAGFTTTAAGWQEAGFRGVFYWSFTHAPDVLAFLTAAVDYVTGAASAAPKSPAPTAAPVLASMDVQAQWTGEAAACQALLERLLSRLSGQSRPTLLVLDGLERAQGKSPTLLQGLAKPPSEEAEITVHGRAVPEGELLEPNLASLLLALAMGSVCATVVATTQSSIPALQPWLGSRCLEVAVPPLTPAEGAELLRYSGVTEGADHDLEQRSIEHYGHTLTLHLLGRYLHAYFEGDGRAVTRSELPTTDTGLHVNDLRGRPGSVSLRQVLRAQLLALPEPARRLLDLCVLVPGPLRISALQALLAQMQQDSIGRGSQPGWPPPSAASFKTPLPPTVLLPDSTWLQGAAGLVERLSDIERLGLLHIVNMPDGEEAIEIHSLIREPIYREWLVGRGGFWPMPQLEAGTLERYMPRGEQALDLLERLVGLLLAAGQPDAAYAVLEQRLGGYLHHVHYLGRARRFLFVIRQLYPAVASTALTDLTWQQRYARLLTWEAETLRVLGQLEAALVTAQRQWPLGSAPLPRRLCQQARVLRSLGRLRSAASVATAAWHGTCSPIDGVLASIELAHIQLLSGDPAMCQVHLLEANRLRREGGVLFTSWSETFDLVMWLQQVWARRALYLGHNARARALLESCRVRAEERRSEHDNAQSDVLMAELLRRERSYELAGQALHRALTAAGRGGDVETQILGGLVQGRLRLDTGHLDAAAAALGPALALASDHGFGAYRIDLLVWSGALALRRGDPELAEREARDALAYATAPDCGYAWGEADALHLLATVLIAGRPTAGSPRHSEAASHLSDELELRERMSDPTAPEVRWLLRRLRS